MSVMSTRQLLGDDVEAESSIPVRLNDLELVVKPAVRPRGIMILPRSIPDGVMATPGEGFEVLRSVSTLFDEFCDLGIFIRSPRSTLDLEVRGIAEF